MILIDGSQGEGGGQILRSALTLSLLTRKSFRIENIRAGRKKPGLLRQHLTAVEAATRISKAEVAGVEIGSRELSFTPGEILPGEYHFAIGTAGSATLVLQTILLPLATASASSHLILEGGTHNPYAPPFDFLQKAFLPLINRMGPEVTVKLERAGFYPAGGGKLAVSIKPVAKLSPLALMEKGELIGKTARAIICNLPLHIAERELHVIAGKMSIAAERLHVEEIKEGPGVGNVVIIELVYENLTEVFTGFGEANIRAEAVAAKAVKEAQEYLAVGAPVGVHLADQLLLPLAYAGEGAFVTLPLTRHAETNIAIIQQFFAVDIVEEKLSGKRRLVKVTRRL